MTANHSFRCLLQRSPWLVAAFVVLWPILVSHGETVKRPNVVLIVADDMGWTGPACYGSDLHETPNLDKLAAQGVRFTQAYSASPVCTPTRASIMTGKHPARLNMTVWHENAVSRQKSKGDEPLAAALSEPNLALEYVTPAEVMREAGYTTLHVGKWHLGDAMHYPETQGFDVNIGGTFFGAPKTYWYPYRGGRTGSRGLREYRYVPDLYFGEEGEYLTDRLTSEAIEVLERAGSQPFFLHLCYHSPHTPIEGKPDLVDYYRNKIREDMDHRNPTYAAMIHSLDINIGRVLDKLEELGVADNTIVIFISDNGGYDRIMDGERVTSNAPLRSGKGSLYEGGIRVPLIVRWPGVTPENTVCSEPVVSMDLYPTLLEALGLKGDTDHNRKLDGLSIVPLLRDPSGSLPRETLYWHYPHYYFNTTPVSSIRQGDWKLLEYFIDGHLELYNLKDDLGETIDLEARMPDITRDLHQRLRQWREDVNARLPEKSDPEG